MPAPAPADRLAGVLRRKLMADLPTLQRALPGRSRRSLFRDLARLDYLVSYSHTGRYFALREVPPFDEEGLWLHRGVGFSRYGTLKDTAAQLVTAAAAGRTHEELECRLHVRVHDALLDLVREARLSREILGGVYVYASAERARAAEQLEARRHLLAAPSPVGALPAVVVVEVLAELIRDARIRASPAAVVAALSTRGLAVTTEEVERVLREHGIEKKGLRSRPRRSPP